MNTIASSNSNTALSYLNTAVDQAKVASIANNTAVKLDESNEVLLKASGPSDPNNFEVKMYQDLTSFRINYNKGFYDDNTGSIDSIIKTAQRYKDYINTNFSDDDKKKYLNCLNDFTKYASEIASSFIAEGIGNFFKLSADETKKVSDNIVSVIDDKINGRARATKSTSLENMDYSTLKTLSAGLASIDKAFEANTLGHFDDINSHAAYLGLANMEASFLNEKSNLPSNIKNQLTKRVGEKVQDGINDTIKLAELIAKLRAEDSKEKGVDLDSIGDYEKEINLEHLKDKISKMNNQFNSIKFDKSFMAGFFAMIDELNKNYSDDIALYKQVDYRLGTKISDGLSEAQSNITGALTSDWNDFINNVYTNDDKSQYLLPSSSHHVVSALV